MLDKITYGWKMRILWIVLHIVLIYSIISAPEYFWYSFAWGCITTMVGGFAGWHRYWAHRSYQTGRKRQVLLLWWGALGFPGKPLPTIGGHRLHHKYADIEGMDIHSPREKSWWENLMGFYEDFPKERRIFKDLYMDPQVRFMQRYYFQIITVAMIVLFLIDPILPGYVLGITGVYQFWVGTFGIVHLLHIFGKADHDTGDDSKNSWLLALFTFGEGWHNNHHNNSLSYTTQEKWYQFDPTGLVIKYFIATDLKHDRIY